MRIYNFLFYKSYQLAQRSKNFTEAPVLGGIIWVMGCFMFNIFTVVFLLEGSGLTGSFILPRKYKYIFSTIFMVYLLFFYTYKSRYKRILESCEEQERRRGRNIPPFIVVIIYLAISFFLALLAAMYKNQDEFFNTN